MFNSSGNQARHLLVLLLSPYGGTGRKGCAGTIFFCNFAGLKTTKRDFDMGQRIISYNINGIRAGLKKGLLDWMQGGGL
jgi:hypothetical protein